MTRSYNHLRYGFGQANYVFDIDAPPAWLVAAIPGAAEARDEWQAENKKGLDLRREWKASGSALFELRKTDPLAADLERAERAHKGLDRALETQGRRALAALRRFDDLVHETRTTTDLRAFAAAEALKHQQIAVEAWQTLKAALEARDQAYAASGHPGLAWDVRHPHNPLGKRTGSLEFIESYIGDFDTAAVQRVADGEPLPEQAQPRPRETKADGIDPAAEGISQSKRPRPTVRTGYDESGTLGARVSK